MGDLYTKIMLTIIAIALAWIGVRPIITPDTVRATESVRIEGIVQVDSAWSSGVKVNCVSGCK